MGQGPSLLARTLSEDIGEFFGVQRPRRRRHPEGQDEDGPQSKEGFLSSKIVGAIPIEKVESKQTLQTWTIKALRKELMDLRVRCRFSKTKYEGPNPIEKAELVELVLVGRGEPICSICFDEFDCAIDYVRCLPCGHRYHIECIDRWLLSKSVRCPICQHPADER